MFDINNRNVGASAAGAVLTASSTYSTNLPKYGGDMLMDPYLYVASNQFVNDACSATSDYYQAVFPPAAGYAGGLPIPISTVYFVNRLGGLNSRIVTSNGAVQLLAPNGSQVGQLCARSSVGWHDGVVEEIARAGVGARAVELRGKITFSNLDALKFSHM